MAVSSSNISMSLGWTLQGTTTGFVSSTQGPDSNTYITLPSTTTYNILYVAQHTITPTGTNYVVINFNSFTDILNEAKTATKVVAIMIQTTGNKVKLEPNSTALSPSGTNPLTWFFGGTTPSITIENGGSMFLCNGTTSGTVSSTESSLRLTNTGTVTNSVVKVTILGGT